MAVIKIKIKHTQHQLYRLHALHFRNACFDEFFNAAFEGYLRKRTATACAKHPHIADVVFKLYKLNIAQMLGDKGTNFFKRAFNFLFDCFHKSLVNNAFFCHSRGSGNPGPLWFRKRIWIPASAGMTEVIIIVEHPILLFELLQFIFLNQPIYKFPIYIFEKNLNICLARRGKIEKICVFIDVHNKERNRVPHASLIVRIA